jgi:regulator of sirC expression with transglutaminase-like and TPR domain
LAVHSRDQFEQLVNLPDERIEVARVALWVAAEEYPDLDVEAYLQRFGRLAAEARSQIGSVEAVGDRVARLNRFLFADQGFSGNRTDYYDPRNSYLNDVLDRRIGIPITLSMVYIEVARRLGLEASGVGFPGHFLIRVAASPDLIIDPFSGSILDEGQCQVRLRNVAGPDAVLQPDVHLTSASPRQTLIRLLSNLKQVFFARRDFERALSCCERSLIVEPDAPSELRDRGLVFEELQYFAAAASDLERFLELAPADASAPAVAKRLEMVRVRIGQLH